ncbi:MAG: pyridoxal phosphate-dependent aminotransferase [Candidatus Methylomirabilales bacterium]
MKEFAARVAGLEVEGAFEVLVRAAGLEREGRSIIHLEIGEPDFPTPPHIVEAAKRALDDGYTRYGPAAGLPELREAVANHIAASRGIPVSPAEVVITPGAKPIMFFSLLALVEAEDEVIYPDPGFPIYASVIRFTGGRAVPLPLLEGKGFSFDLEVLEGLITPKTRLLILNSPHNPTGGIVGKEELERIAELSDRFGFWVLSDEVYHRFCYEVGHVSILSLPRMKSRTILLDGFSKSYAMTGWRLGYGVMPVPLAEQVGKLMVNSNSCTATFVQKAGVAALSGDQLSSRQMVESFHRRRDLLVAGLNRIPGIRCPLPAGAFYAFPNVTAFGRPAQAIADHLLEDGGVACLPGTAFGSGGEGYLRLSYATAETQLKEAIIRIAASLAQLDL